MQPYGRLGRVGSALSVLSLTASLACAEQGEDNTTDKKRAAPGAGGQQESCESLPEEVRRRTEACKTEAERREDDYERRLAEAALKEKPKRTSFLKWLHTDAMWIPTSSGHSAYGLIGAHIGIAEFGRMYLFGPPGVMLLLENTPTGQRVRPALTWGFGAHLTTFRVPTTSKQAHLYLNLVKCWTSGGMNTGMDMAGFSLTWKQ